MCGGIGFNLNNIDTKELLHFYEPEELEQFKKTGVGLSFFWNREPALPVRDGQAEVKLLRWGNRDKDTRLPKTGWAKSESLKSGKWDHLEPKKIIIPAVKGYEKGKWFPIDKGIRGIVIDKDGEQRVYLVTKQSTPEYLNFTNHDREPDLC